MYKYFEIYNLIKPDIDKRIAEFKSLYKTASEVRIFQELCFCLLTSQSNAKHAWKAMESLYKEDIIFKADDKSISVYLNIVRFKNNKAIYIVKAREQFGKSGKIDVRTVLDQYKSATEKRNFLETNITGYGLKEASHFIRNVGFVEDVAILDRHILRCLNELNVINEIPKSLTKSLYLEIEQRMKDFSDKIKIPLGHLDLVFWYKAKNEIFK